MVAASKSNIAGSCLTLSNHSLNVRSAAHVADYPIPPYDPAFLAPMATAAMAAELIAEGSGNDADSDKEAEGGGGQQMLYGLQGGLLPVVKQALHTVVVRIRAAGQHVCACKQAIRYLSHDDSISHHRSICTPGTVHVRTSCSDQSFAAAGAAQAQGRTGWSKQRGKCRVRKAQSSTASAAQGRARGKARQRIAAGGARTRLTCAGALATRVAGRASD